MRSIFDHLAPEDVIRSVLSETQDAIGVVQQMSGFLVDPSAGFLTKHQKDVAYKLYQNAEHLSYILEELNKYHTNLPNESRLDDETTAVDDNR